MPRLSLRADAGVGAVAISPNSRDAVLAGRSGLYVVDLFDPFALPRWLPLHSAWEVPCVKWCPHYQRQALLVSSHNQKALVWNLALPSERAVEHVLHGHRRAVTDIDFSPHHGDQLSTASIDTTVRIWDLRLGDRTVQTFSDFRAGAIQTRWSMSNENQIVSAHDNRFVLWDRRRQNLPIVTVSAHQVECNSVQFLANGRLMSSSTDRSIKLWNMDTITTIQEPELHIDAEFPIWRTVPTPFELGALVVPLRGGDNQVSLINLARQSGRKQMKDLVAGETSLRHPDSITDAICMRYDKSASHYDVVTWCHDSHLRQWNGSFLRDLPHASSAAGCKDDDPPALSESRRTFNTDDFDNAISSGVKDVFSFPLSTNRRKHESQSFGHLDWIAGVRLGHPHLDAEGAEGDQLERVSQKDMAVSADRLSQEIIFVSSKFPKVVFEDINIGAGTCDFNLNGPWGNNHDIVRIQMHARIHKEYPNGPIEFSVSDASEIREGGAQEITEKLKEYCDELSRHNVHSLEFAIRYLVGDPVSVEDSLAGESFYSEQLRKTDVLEADDFGSDERLTNSDASDEDELLKSEYAFDKTIIEGDYGGINESQNMNDSDGDIESGSPGKSRMSPHYSGRDDIIDSTPVPKNCGAVWSPSGFLVCFFNRKPAGKDKGPLPLDKIFADDAQSDESNAPFLSDSDDFENHFRHTSLHNAKNWSVTAAQLTANPNLVTSPAVVPPAGSGMLVPSITGGAAFGFGRGRSKTLTSLASDEKSISVRHNATPTSTHNIVIKNMLHLWPCRPDVASEYIVYMGGEPLEVVEHNKEVATRYKLWDEVYIWKLLYSYISVEEAECIAYHPSVNHGNPKFDWCGGRTGLRKFLPDMAQYLEQTGRIQILACMALLFSSLHSRREFLWRVKDRNVTPLVPIVVLQPQVESIFQAHRDGTMSFIGDRKVDEESALNTPGSISTEVFVTKDSANLAAWAGESHSPHSTSDYLSAKGNAASAGSRRLSAMGVVDHEEGFWSRANSGPLIGIELDSNVFDFDYPPSTFSVLRNEQNAKRDFLEWFPRIMNYRSRYASLLQMWGLNIKRAEVAKLSPYYIKIMEKNPECYKSDAPDGWIDIQVTKSASCALCSMPITKLFGYCEHCSHAMHSNCAHQWWETENECPSACGCDCRNYVG